MNLPLLIVLYVLITGMIAIHVGIIEATVTVLVSAWIGFILYLFSKWV